MERKIVTVEESQARASKLADTYCLKSKSLQENFKEIAVKRKEKYETKLKEYSEKMSQEYDRHNNENNMAKNFTDITEWIENLSYKNINLIEFLA